MTLAWHFCNGGTLRDGRPIPPDGVTLRHRGTVVPCERGLHASERLIDALEYAPGHTICRVRLGGTIVPHAGDKYAASERTILWRTGGKEILKAFARQCALDVIHLWDAPTIVREYLTTGREDIRDAAWAAACAAPGAAASAAAYAATQNAAYAAVRAVSATVSAPVWVGTWDAAKDAQNVRLTDLVMTEAARLGFEMEPAP